MKNKFKFLKSILLKLVNYPLLIIIGYLYTKLFGTLKNKIAYSVFRLPHYAFGIHEAALRAKHIGLKNITVIEFGVANGRGLIAMSKYALLIQKEYGINISVIGFDSGEGMPKHEGYKDHPELYIAGDFPMQDAETLKNILPTNTKLIIVNLNSEDWTKYISKDAPIGFISIDVDYYSSTSNILKYLHTINIDKIVHNSLFYFDDVALDNHNSYQGELLAIEEFNKNSVHRKFDFVYYRLKQKQRLNQEAWLWQMYQLHCLEHSIRNKEYRSNSDTPQIITNKYLKI